MVYLNQFIFYLHSSCVKNEMIGLPYTKYIEIFLTLIDTIMTMIEKNRDGNYLGSK